jgi:hypothetical protein
MTMLADYVITSKLLYGFVHLAQKKSLHTNICAVFLKLIDIEIKKLYRILLICSIAV